MLTLILPDRALFLQFLLHYQILACDLQLLANDDPLPTVCYRRGLSRCDLVSYYISCLDRINHSELQYSYMIPHVYAVDISTDFAPARHFGTVSSLVNLVVPILMVLVAVTLLVMFLWGGYDTLRAGPDNSERVAKSKNIFTYAIIGLVIIIASFLIVKILGKILGVPIL